MTEKQLQQKMKALDVAYKIIDETLKELHKKASTLQRIKIRGIQMCISKIVELELLIEKECNQ